MKLIIAGSLLAAAVSAAAIGAAPANADTNSGERGISSVGSGPCIADMKVAAITRSSRPGKVEVVVRSTVRGLGPCSTQLIVNWAPDPVPSGPLIDKNDLRKQMPGAGTRYMAVTAPGTQVLELPIGPGRKLINVVPGSPFMSGGSLYAIVQK